jgi:hypothetical protein
VVTDLWPNAVVIVLSVAGGILFCTFIRQPTLISDRQFRAVDDPASLRRDSDV